MSEQGPGYATSRNYFDTGNAIRPEKDFLDKLVTGLEEQAEQAISNPAFDPELRSSLRSAAECARTHQKMFAGARDRLDEAMALQHYGEARALMNACNFHRRQIDEQVKLVRQHTSGLSGATQPITGENSGQTL